MSRRMMLMTTQEKVAAGMSGQDVKVTFDGSRPVVNVSTGHIRLPPPPEEVDEETEINTRSWIDHESSHLRFGTEPWTREVVSDKVMKNLCFGLEDCRVDRLNGEKFPGTRDNRRRGFDIVRPKLKVRNVLQAAYYVLYEQVKQYHTLSDSIIFWTEHLKEPSAALGLAQLMESISDLIEKLRIVGTQQEVIRIAAQIKTRWKDIFESGRPDQDDQNSEDGKNDKMSDGGAFGGKKRQDKEDKNEEDHPQKSSGKQQPDDNQSDNQSDDESGKAGNEKPSDDSDKSDDGEPEERDSEDTSDDPDSDDDDSSEDSNETGAEDESDVNVDANKSDDNADDPTASNEDSADTDLDDSDDGSNDGDGEDDPDDKDDTDSSDTGLPEDRKNNRAKSGDADSKMAEMMKDFEPVSEAEQNELEQRFNQSNADEDDTDFDSCPPGYRAFTGDDVVIELEPQEDGLVRYDEDGRAMRAGRGGAASTISPAEFRSDIRAKLGTFQRRLLRAMLSRRRLWVKDREQGDIDDTRLFRVATADKRVFKRRLQRPSINIAVSVLLDMSGSMAGYEQYLCAQLGYILAETCGLIRIPFECLGFTTGYSIRSSSRHQRGYVGSGDNVQVPGIYYHRTNPLKLIVVKPFEMAKRSDMLYRMYAAAAWTGGGTTEGEAIWWAARRLSKQPRQRKLLITICDGAPNGSPAPEQKFKEHVTCVIKRLHAAHIETMHVGIKTDDPKEYVPEGTFVRYDGIESLITEFAPAFGSILLRERRRSTVEDTAR